MTHNHDSVAAFDQLLWGLQPHSAASASPTSMQFLHEFPTSTASPENLQPTATTFNLNDLEQQALLDVLNEYKEPLETSAVLPFNTSHVDAQVSAQTLCAVGKHAGDESAGAAFKLAAQRAKATKRRNHHRKRVKAEWEALRLQNKQLSAQLEALKSSRISTGGLQWHEQASKELKARLQVENEQYILRLAIEHRAIVIEKLLESWRQVESSKMKDEPDQECVR